MAWCHALHGAVPEFLQNLMVLLEAMLLLSLKPEHGVPLCHHCKDNTEVSQRILHYFCAFKRSMGAELLATLRNDISEWAGRGRAMLFSVENDARTELWIYLFLTCTAFQITCS